MKKLLFIISVMLLLMVSVVSAQKFGETQQTMSKDRDMIQERNETQEKINLTGLPNAMLRVRNEETRMHLEQVWAKIQAKDMARLNMTKVEFSEDDSGKVLMKGVKEAKFLGLVDVNKQYKYTLNDDGTISRVKQGIDFLFKMQE
jgi:type II secretory pathway component PulK